MSAIVLSIVNQKGGVGKTTTTVNVATYLATRGKRVLLIDMDPQGNATSGLGISKQGEGDSIYDVLINHKPILDCLRETSRRQLKICPSSIHLAGSEIELVEKEERESILRQALIGVRDVFDFVLIDCPPSLGLLTLNALVASTGVIIPVQSEFYAMEGLSQIMNTLELVQTSLNPELRIFGVLITMYDNRTSLSQQVSEQIQEFFEDICFKTIIPRNVKLSEAPSHGKSIQEYDPKSKGAQAYHDLTREIVKRAKLFQKGED